MERVILCRRPANLRKMKGQRCLFPFQSFLLEETFLNPPSDMPSGCVHDSTPGQLHWCNLLQDSFCVPARRSALRTVVTEQQAHAVTGPGHHLPLLDLVSAGACQPSLCSSLSKLQSAVTCGLGLAMLLLWMLICHRLFFLAPEG